MTGSGSQLSAAEYLMFRGEGRSRTRTGILSVEILECAPEWERFVEAFERASRAVPRMRQKVVVPSVPTTSPRWVTDPDFDLGYHLRRIALPAPGSHRQLLDTAEVLIQSRFDTSRPLWTVTLVEGIDGGRAAVLSHFSHAITDGVGGVELFSQVYDLAPDGGDRPLPLLPAPTDLSSPELARQGLSELPAAVLGLATGAVRASARAVTAPKDAAGGVVSYARSAGRVLGKASMEPSPLLRRRGTGSRTVTLNLDLTDLKTAGTRHGGTVNDVFVAGLCSGLRRYHQEKGVPVDTLPLAIPVNLRPADRAPAGGNHFSALTVAAPVGDMEVGQRIAQIHDQVLSGRGESAIDLAGKLAGVLAVLPQAALDAVVELAPPTDVQASNVPSYPGDTYLAGARVLEQYGVGPLPGVAVMVVMVTRCGRCFVTARYDTAAITDDAAFERCLTEGYADVTASPRRELGMTRQSKLRLPGSLAEVAASPEGANVGAFFDLDGTLVAGMTAAEHTKERLRTRATGRGEFLKMLRLAIDYRLGRVEFEAMLRQGVASLSGEPYKALDETGERLFQAKIADLVYPEMRELVRAHQERGHTVVLASSAMSMQAEPVARFLGIDAVLCNRFEVDDGGALTGEVLSPVIWAGGKADAVQSFSRDNGIDLGLSYFYADGDEDLALMYLVGHPRPTNPGKRLASVASRRGWPILRFTSRGGFSLCTAARTAIGIGAAVPLAAASVVTGVVNRDKWRGINVFLGNWPQVFLNVNGVKTRVIGADNAAAPRPAVYIFNHRNNFDAFIAATVIKDNFTGVAKKELESAPIVGQLGKLMDSAFIDRSDSQSAVASLATVEENAKRGLSVLVSPEGTRVDTSTVGPFKKGPFRIAMSAGLPIVPIVICNAEYVAGRNSSVLNPGTVDVIVLPPVSVEDWTTDDLEERIADVRQMFVDTLLAWQTGEMDD